MIRSQSNSPRNIVYLHSHDTGRYIQPYGYAVGTPNLQQLAMRGVLFRNAFCANPTCSPSRACLLTGQYAHSNGMMGLAHRGGRLNDPSHLLPTYLREHGYDTVLAGYQHVAFKNPMDNFGYSTDLSAQRPETQAMGKIGEDRDDATTRDACAYLKLASHDRPFFLDVGYYLTHRTAHTPEGIQWHHEDGPLGDQRYVRPPACLPDTPKTRRDFADFCHAVGRLDQHIGQVIRALSDTHRVDDTLVIVTTDHGIAFPHMKCQLTDHGLGVMLVIAGPGAHDAGRDATPFAGGRVMQGMVSHVDLFPTICDVLGLPHPQWLQGQSMIPMLGNGNGGVSGESDERQHVGGDVSDDDVSIRDEIFAEVNYHAAREPMRAVRTDRYKYIRHLEPLSHPILANCDASVSKNMLIDAGWPTHAQESEQLFDLMFDPNESHNLIHEASHQSVADDMRQRLDRWMHDTSDPALEGPIRASGMRDDPV